MIETDLRREGFIGTSKIRSGVVVLMRGEEVLFITKSRSVWYWLLKLHSKSRYLPYKVEEPIPFDRILVKHCSEHEAMCLEADLVHRYRPRYNVTRRTMPVLDYGLPLDELAEAVGIKWNQDLYPEVLTKKKDSYQISRPSFA
jgi:hypothetical protein